jgi:hypothetical protein
MLSARLIDPPKPGNCVIAYRCAAEFREARLRRECGLDLKLAGGEIWATAAKPVTVELTINNKVRMRFIDASLFKFSASNWLTRSFR